MTSIPVLLQNKGKEPEIRVVAPDTGGISVGLGALWIVGTAAAWNVSWWRSLTLRLDCCRRPFFRDGVGARSISSPT